jgi:drug/metabolite transporter (DMT)-like permease
MNPSTMADVAALGAAAAWAAGGIVAVVPVAAVGPFTFNRWRMTAVAVVLAGVTTLLGTWHTLDGAGVAWLVLSGAVGMALGDNLLFSALPRLGPRRNAVVYATNAPMAAVLGWLLFGESLPLAALCGIGLVTAGVMLAVGQRTGESHGWETVRGRLGVGIGLALAAALCQALGVIAAAPAMRAGVDPLAAATVRVAASAALNIALRAVTGDWMAPRGPATPRVLGLLALNATLGLGIGMTLIMVGLAHGDAGIVATLSATSPVLILPMLWVILRRRPAGSGWAGAVLAVAGVALIVNRG